jgi:hypothetical protein
MVSDIIVSISALSVAVIAFFGLRTWRKELTGKAKFNLARDLMLLGLKLQAHFEGARGLFTSSAEFIDRPRKEDETPDVSQVLDEWYARANRLKPLHENLIKIQEASWEAKILFDEDASEAVSEAVFVYRHNFAELSSAVSSYFDTKRQAAKSGIPYEDQDWLKKLHRTIYTPSGDDFSKQIEGATTKLESALQAYVK